ncbi:MAG: DUF5009 domain-containing protein [Prolixibacteraceae bacterium]|jgi:predicted acyltransferase|nr:DUF5009 domain-containing protein [Prolixibacteraceae bacterium]OQB78787.1 MAG: hypothetical protein BWX87_02518 [Bacteroidetes bacterium ADurb.Bin123]HOG97154.1 DUF5009 domain-containing protein [Prolixibacteraceae bacterium]HPV19558.1 DUF5009 domain-containing protein [Prolixibacteraceae bacterium]
MTNHSPTTDRIASVDIFRALTMLLMIFVNDMAGLANIPGWMKHTAADVDGMGLSDVVFPAFLFIVGLSIPHALRARFAKGETKGRIAVHILLRSLALIIMGFFLVNLENIQPDGLVISKHVYAIFLILAFFLIWNLYPGAVIAGKVRRSWLRGAGILLLILLAVIYKGGTPEDPSWMKPRWWGILGLIGWAYLVSAFIYLFAWNRFWLVALALVVFSFLNFAEVSPLFEHLPTFKLIISASNYVLVMGGVFATAMYHRIPPFKEKSWIYAGLLVFLAVIIAGYGFDVRPLGGISKIRATPSWTSLCMGISLAVYALLYLLADKFKITKWAAFISPAGRSTLTCYLLPYLVYPVMRLSGFQWPPLLSSGGAGLLRSFAFALLIIWVTGLLGKIQIRLRI